MHSGVAGLIPRVHDGAGRDKDPHCRRQDGRAGDVQRRVASVYVDVGASLGEGLRSRRDRRPIDALVKNRIEDEDLQRRVASGARDVEVGASLGEDLHHVRAVEGDGDVKRRVITGVRGTAMAPALIKRRSASAEKKSA